MPSGTCTPFSTGSTPMAVSRMANPLVISGVRMNGIISRTFRTSGKPKITGSLTPIKLGTIAKRPSVL
ncbi:hypothetical protein D1872_336610 [compost metagenome]